MKDKIEFLKKLPLFFNMNDEEILKVLSFFNAYEKNFSKSNFVFEIGKPIDKIGIILSGEINIIKEDYWGNRNILNKFVKGNIFGEVFAISKSLPLNIAVETSCETIILFLDFSNFSLNSTFIDIEINKFLSNIFSISLKKNILLTEKIEHITKKSIREKILSYLSTIALKKKSNTFDIPFDRQELADYLSVERSALSRELSSMKKDGIIDYKKNNFILHK